MGRKCIFDILSENDFSPSLEFARLNYYFSNLDNSRDYGMRSVREHIEESVFKKLPIKNTFINFDDLLTCGLRLNLNKNDADYDDLFNFIELILCIVDSDYDGYNFLYEPLLNNIRIILEKTCHKIVEKDGHKIIVPNNSKIEEAALLIDDKKISLEVLYYNHRSNVGNLKSKKNILLSIGKFYEGKLKKDKSELSKGIGFLLNNLDLRHNNTISGQDVFMKNVGDKLEQWYDKLYSLFIAYTIEQEKLSILSEITKLKTTK